ncbi:unnamed protein product [Prorocentrum cordatum]|uniref:EGF-like domain-containing protein n=1 Tax=Prorocentrum cordatum TaxID=2364126 RepID=A0ABN9RI44_9DINO|nr:unnamed protein product [Polarella glacialis]
MVLQAPRDRNGSVLVVGAPEGGARMVFPKPSWAQQKCVYESSSLTLSGQECSGRGSCLLDGRCQCSSGRGSYCEEQASSLHESSFESFWVENAQLILMLSAAFLIVGCAALAMGILVPFRRRRRRRAKKAARQLLDEALAHEHWEDVCKRCFSKGRSMIASSLSTSEIEEHMRLKSERWGISVAYLLSEEFTGLARRRSGEDDPTFYQLRDVFFLGADPIGERERCPRDGYDGCAFVDSRVLPAKHRGKCTHFLSWTWAYRLSVVQDALRSWIEELEHDGLAEEESAETVYLYMCFFVNNQYRILDQSKKRDKAKTGSDNLASVFEENLRSIGRVLALFDVWNGPTYLTRIWTIFEQAMAIKLSIEPQIIMPKAEIRTLMGQLAHGNEGISRVKTALFKVNTERAEASVQKDKENVQHMILDTFGSFTYVDSQIKKLMVRWLGRATESIFHDLMRQDSQRSLPVDPDGPSEGPQPGISILRARPRALFKSLSTRSMRYWGKVAAVGPYSPSGSPRALDPDPWQVPNASKLPGVPSREELHRDGDALPALLS